jgi:hypothetical protein
MEFPATRGQAKSGEESGQIGMRPSLRPLVEAARSAALAVGHAPDRCDILQDGDTLVLRLSETLVARVLTQPDGPRKGDAWFSREMAVASHLTCAGAPVIPLHPDFPPTPIQQGGFTLNFWKFVTQLTSPPPPEEVGRALLRCHEALLSFPEELPHMAILTESLSLLPGNFSPEIAGLLGSALKSGLSALRELPAPALHGDAHLGNALNTTEGLLWTDWEDAFAGPVEWDLASAIWNARILENDESTAQGILAGYGPCDETALRSSLAARAAVMCAWYPVLYPQPDASRREKLQFRLDWLKANKTA